MDTPQLVLAFMPDSAFHGPWEIVVRRNPRSAYISSQTVGTDAVNALWRVPGVEEVELLEESDVDAEGGQAKLAYAYASSERYMAIDTHLDKFGLERVR